MKKTIRTGQGIKVQFETFTKEDARELLENHNDHNRPLKKDNLAYLIKRMNDGTFLSDNGETIIISDTGRLLDGQTRFTAFLNSELLSITFLVVRGVTDEAFTTIDQGVKRTPADVFYIAHSDDQDVKNNHKSLSKIANALLKLERGLKNTNTSVTDAGLSVETINDRFDKNPTLFKSVLKLATDYRLKMRVVSEGLLAALIAYTMEHSSFKTSAVAEFWNTLFLEEIAESEPISLLKKRFERVLKDELDGSRTKTRDSLKMSWIVAAYNAHFAGGKVKLEPGLKAVDFK